MKQTLFLVWAFLLISITGCMGFYLYDSSQILSFLLLNLSVFAVFWLAVFAFLKSLVTNYDQAGFVYIGVSFAGLILITIGLLILSQLKIISILFLIVFGIIFIIYLTICAIFTQKKLQSSNADKKH